MGNKLTQHPERFFCRDAYHVFDDFVHYTNADEWTVLTETNTTAAHEGSAGKTRVALSCLNNDNNEAGIFTTNEVFKFIANKAIYGEGLIQYAEANTSAANVWFGFADAPGANAITDNGGACTINDSGAVIYKLDGGTVWRFKTAIGGSATDSISDTTAGGSTAQLLAIEIVPVSSTVFEARPFVNGVQLKTSAGVKIMHRITLGTATDMDFGAYLKQGSTTNEAVYVDYLFAEQNR